jgi:hypothetical protein
MVLRCHWCDCGRYYCHEPRQINLDLIVKELHPQVHIYKALLLFKAISITKSRDGNQYVENEFVTRIQKS